MNVQSMQRWSAVAGIALVVLGGGIWYLQPSQATAEKPCANDWANSPSREERERCGRVKAMWVQQVRMHERQTAAVLPTGTPLIPHFKPVKLTPTALDQKIEEVPLEATLGGPPNMRGVTSMWRVGSVFNPSGTTLSRFFVFSKPGQAGHPLIETDVLNAGEYANPYRRSWSAPRAIGAIQITGVTGQTGIVSFTSASGQQGTLDMATGTWVFTP